MTKKICLGRWGENLAKQYLLKNGYIFYEANYRSGKGEIDLIFYNRGLHIFVEVKTRTKNAESKEENPLQTRQIKKIEQTMIDYCLPRRINLNCIRLDLIIILVDWKTKKANLKHFRDII